MALTLGNVVNATQSPLGQAAITAATGGAVNPATVALAAKVGSAIGVLPPSANSSNSSGTDRYQAYVQSALNGDIKGLASDIIKDTAKDTINDYLGGTPLADIANDAVDNVVNSAMDAATSGSASSDPGDSTSVNLGDVSTLPTLADILNKLVADKEAGFVTRKLAPSGQGTYLNQVADLAMEASGYGDPHFMIANVFRNVDRYEKSMAMKNMEFAGYTFITRPRLNFSDLNIAGDRRFYAMRDTDASSVALATRCLLDTRYNKTHDSPLVDARNPFAVILGNSLVGISGYNDPFITTESTDGGYFQEDQTYAIGGDRMSRTYDLTLTFRDYVGGPVSYIFDMWYQYIMNLQDGSMIQYADAIDSNRMDYTVSIYRFILDRTRKIITRWSKATGCFPVNAPTGVPFNKNQGESYVTANDNFGITFKANRIEYNDPIIVHEFNMLVRRYANMKVGQSIQAYAKVAQNNFAGIPYIRANTLGHEMIFVRPSDSKDTVMGSGNVDGNVM